MKKIFVRFCIVFSAVLVLTAFPLGLSAESGRVFDESGVLTGEELSTVETELEELNKQTGWNLAIVTTDDAEGKTAQAYADDFYDKLYGINTDGVLFLIDFDNREQYISTSGAAIDYFTNNRLDSIWEATTPSLQAGSYAEVLSAVIQKIGDYYAAGIPDGQYRYEEGTEGSKFAVIPIAAVVGAAGMGICALIIMGRYKFHRIPNAVSYLNQGETVFLERSDNFLREYTTSVKIQQNTNNGGGSGTHTSSGGGTHGGGGSKF